MRADRSLLRCVLVVCGLAAPGAVLAQSAVCQGLRNELASLTQAGDSRAGVYLDAAQRQVGEMQRMAAYGRAIGCDRTRFLMFGSDPPPQCGDVAARMARMQANLARLRARASQLGGAATIATRRRQTEEAIRQYCSEVPLTDASAVPPTQPFEDGAQDDAGQDGAGPLDATDPYADPDAPQPDAAQTRLPPGKPVCVRMCDGYFFPLASAGDLGPGGEPQMCQAQCPGAETQAFSMRDGDDIAQAVGPGGESYMETSNALRYQKARVPSCSCRKSGESWGQALRGAQDMLGTNDSEVIVSAEKAEKMSRPAMPAQARKPARQTAGAAVEADAPPARPAPTGGPRTLGPDGKRDVRVIAPPSP